MCAEIVGTNRDGRSIINVISFCQGKSMKPQWDALAESYADSSSVGVYDVDCTVEGELCQKHGVQGYPTIKYYKDGDKEGQKYLSGRDAASLKTFVKDTLERPCVVSSGEGCTDKEKKYIEKQKAKDARDKRKGKHRGRGHG